MANINMLKLFVAYRKVSIGILFIVGVIVCMHTLRSTSSSTTTITSLLRGETEEAEYNNDRADGWHPIHVYYGEAESEINPDPTISHSQAKQDEIILALMDKLDDDEINDTPGRRFYIDLASNDATEASNTLQLENNGWEGLCIEPNPIFWYKLAHRSCTVVASFVGGVEDKVPIKAHFRPGEDGLAGIIGEGFDNKDELPGSVNRYTVSLRSVFEKFNVPQSIDYLSLDVEGAESLIMKDFPFDTYRFKFMTVERPKPDLEALLEAKGYLFIMKTTNWGETVWVHNTTAIDFNEAKDIVSGISCKLDTWQAINCEPSER